MFNCEYCAFETRHKSNYTAHLKTKRHLTKLNISPSLVHQLSITCPSIHSCNSCNKSFASQSSLSKHHKKCIFVQIIDLENKIVDKDKKLKYNKKIQDSYILEIKELRHEIKDLTKEINRVKDTQLSVLQNNLKPSNTNNSQIIINNYPNAPNLGFPDNIRVDESLKEYIQLGGIKGLSKFISDYWVKNVKPIDRSIWMVDPSRNKFLIRCKDSWVIDIDGTQFQELNLEKIQNIFDDYITKYEFDAHDQIKTMEFINDIKTKNMIVKGLKDAGKYLVYDKERFTDFETIENEIIPEPVIETIVD